MRTFYQFLSENTEINQLIDYKIRSEEIAIIFLNAAYLGPKNTFEKLSEEARLVQEIHDNIIVIIKSLKSNAHQNIPNAYRIIKNNTFALSRLTKKLGSLHELQNMESYISNLLSHLQ
jgi:hypothetical protein